MIKNHNNHGLMKATLVHRLVTCCTNDSLVEFKFHQRLQEPLPLVSESLYT